MKKIISLIAAIAMTTTISFGATFTKVSGGHSISINVDSGKAVKIRALDIFGKIFNGWTIIGATVNDQSQKEIEITIGENDVTATANYLTPYTITVNQTANGVISPSTVTVGEGTNQVFTITPNTSHKIVDVLLDGTSVLSSLVAGTGNEKTYTLSNIQGNHILTASFAVGDTYTITYNLDGGTVTGNPTSYTSTDTITLNNPNKEGYVFKGWTGSNGTTPSTTVTIPAGSTGNKEYTANWEVELEYSDGTIGGVNRPVLSEGLTPVNWDSATGKWVKATTTWNYNYNSVAEATHSTVEGNGNGKWANARTADGSLYVWIPRYSYKITSGEHQSGNSWNSLDAAGTNKVEVKFSNGTTDDTSNSYIAHPAFTFGTDELEGIWVAKYEASQGNTTSELSAPTSSTTVAKSIPGVVSWKSLNPSNAFDYAYNTYRDADSHLMKNIEWGAVAYLTNAIGRTPYINNYYVNTTMLTGNAGDSQNASTSSSTYAWNTASGVKASTTHNVYGIYDMSGGVFEFVSAYYVGGSTSNMSSLVKTTDKYVDRYITAYDSNKNGDAVYETSSNGATTYNLSKNSWDSDGSNLPSSSYPVFTRGGHCVQNEAAGIFYFNNNECNGASAMGGFRVVLGIK